MSKRLTMIGLPIHILLVVLFRSFVLSFFFSFFPATDRVAVNVLTQIFG